MNVNKDCLICEYGKINELIILIIYLIVYNKLNILLISDFILNYYCFFFLQGYRWNFQLKECEKCYND